VVKPAVSGTGPFVEVSPVGPSSAPPLSIHVFDIGYVAVTVGETAAGDWTDDVEPMLDTLEQLTRNLVLGKLSEEVVRGRRGKVWSSKLLVERDGKPETLWVRTSLPGLALFRRKETRTFPAYPPLRSGS